jgi:hypothetical protein
MHKLCLLSCLALAVSANAQTGPKVVFTGDEFTYTWQQSPAFQANKNWIGAGIPGIPGGPGINNRISEVVLSEFQTNVINQHPAFVFIETGASDIAWQSDSTPYGLSWETAVDAIIGMVKMARAAGIKVILGNIVTTGFQSDHYNLWLQAYTQAENIPLVNFQYMLEGGNTESGPNGICLPCTYDADTGTPVLLTSTGGPFSMLVPTVSMLVPTDEGSKYLTQMAQTAIATYGLKIKGGYLSDVQAVDGLNDDEPPFVPSVNGVAIGAGVQFTPQATWSDGVTRPMQNIPYGGVIGTWSSTNPKVMSVNQQGFAYAFTPGTTTIWFKSASGQTFSPWIMTVGAAYPGPPDVPVPTY